MYDCVDCIRSPVADCPTCLAETNDVDDPPAATNWIIAVVAGAIVAILGCIFICCRCNKSNKQHWEPVGTVCQLCLVVVFGALLIMHSNRDK